jgi:hypothetical protein
MRLLPVLASVAAAALLAGCGGGSGDSTATTSTSATASRADASVDAILAAMRADVAKADGFHFDGTGKDRKDGDQRLTGDVTADGRAAMTMVDGKGRSLDFRVVGRGTYLRASAGFWRKEDRENGDTLAQLFGGRWVKVPTASLDDVEGDLKRILPKTLARCATVDLGTLTKAGAGKVGGVPTVVLKGDGSAPGTNAGTIEIAATGPAFPLRITQDGPRRKGGTVDRVCHDDDEDTTITSTITLSRFDDPVDVQAPPNALDLEQLKKRAGGGGTGVKT